MLARRVSILALVCVTALACGDDNEQTAPAPTATSTPTATAPTPATPAPTATVTPAPTSSTPTSTPVPQAVAKRIDDPADLIGGTLAIGRIGDYLIANDKVRAIVRAPGREMSLALLYGGNIVDADIVRPPGEPGRDNFGGMLPDINLSLTVNVQEVVVVNDGANGEPAVLRAVGVDDLLDAFDLVNAIKAFGFGMVPPSAQDRDLPLEIATEYTLGLGDEAIRIETMIKNVGDEDLRVYVGDLLNASGEDDTFVPPVGFGDALLYTDLPYVAYSGRGANRGISYGIIPEPIPGTPLTASGFGQAGIMGFLLGQSFLNVLLAQEPGILPIPAGETRSYVRYFAIGGGDSGSIADIRNALFGIPAGTVSGLVTAGGEPAAGAFVSVVQKPGEGGAPYRVLNGFRTDGEGRYEGSMPPGDYLVMAKLEGYPYDSGTSVPGEHPISVTAGGRTVRDIALPPTARLRVTVAGAGGDPLPAKVSVVGFDPAPEPENGAGAFVFRSNVSEQGTELFGLTAVRFVDQSGDSGEFPLPPSDYEVVVSRGPEYSIHRERVSLASGATATVNARLARVLDTSGFVSADYHVHLVHSWDCSVTRDDRIRTMAAEGVDYFVASDHDFVTDLRPDVARLGLEDHLAAVVGSEVTTFNLGHFNVWPLVRDPDSYTGGSIDWGRAGVPPGQDFPSLGSYDLSPAELFAAARARVEPASDGGVIQVNHFNSGTLGYLALAGIDTALDPPQSFTPVELIRQDPRIENLYDDGFDTLEVWIAASRSQTSLFQNANMGDWFNLLNQGRIKAGTSNSDTHSTAIVQAGGPRNFVASSSDHPRELDDAELAASVRDGRLIGSSAPFLRVTIEGDGGAVAGLAFGEPKLVAATSGSATVRVHVQSASWAEFDTLEVFANTVPFAVPDENMHGAAVPRYDVEPTMVLQAGSDFEVESVVVDPAVPGAARLEAEVEIPLAVERDTWVVVLVKGTDGVSRPIWPMNPQDLDQEKNVTLDDLTDGNLGEGGNPALAFSNPLFIDADGNGRFDPSGEMP
jgi:hypothetical protein